MRRTMLRWGALCALALLVGDAVHAQEPANVAGKWELSMEGRQGPVTQELTIEQTGEKIKGTLKGPRGESAFEGKVKGKEVTWSVKRETPRGEMVIEYSGKVDGDTMKGTMGGGQFTREWTAKKMK